MAVNSHAIKRQSKLDQTNNLAPHDLIMVITFVNRNKADFYVDIIQSFGVNLQVDTLATEKAAETGVLQYLGLTNTDQVAIFSFIRDDKVNKLMDLLSEKFRTIRNGKGVSVAVPLSSMIGKLVFGFLSNNEKVIREVKK